MSSTKARMKANIDKLTRERDRLMAEAEAIKHRIAGIETAISLISQDGDQPQAGETGKRGAVKTVLLDLLREVGTTGLNATSAVEIAHRRGIRLERGTAASNLSRMKADGVVIHDGDKYRLPEFSRQRPLGNLLVVGKSS